MGQVRRDDAVYLYQLIISQLLNDGFTRAASVVSEATCIPLQQDIPEHRLSNLVQLGLASESGEGISTDTRILLDERTTEKVSGLDFELEALQNMVSTRSYTNYVTRFHTPHKNGCRVAKFSNDGQLVATGSADTSIKLLDVSKMKNFNNQKTEPADQYGSSHPVIRTFYDHTQPISDLDFHPYSPILISCSRDCSLKFFDFKSSVKRAFRFIQDTHNVRSVNFHPSGDFLLSGTDHPMIRLYDLTTFQPYVSSESKDHHQGPINQVRYSTDGNLYVSCSKDGSIKVWDAVSSRCVKYISKAHAGFEVNSVQFSRNSKYVLSGGKDSTVRLWDLATGRQLKVYTGSAQSKNRLQTTFSYNEDLIISSDENMYLCVVWDTHTGDIKQNLTGHNNIVRWVCSSPVEPALMTCSDDRRARFWCLET
jgi:cleavage stimulation factor subunit 1